VDIKLNKLSHDIDITNGSPSLITGRDAIHQHLKIRILWFQGEWFLSPDLGIPYFSRIFIRNVNEADVVSIYTNVTANTPGIKSVDSVTLDPDFESREVTITIKATDINGSFDFNTLIPVP
jgi:hypothetical protein